MQVLLHALRRLGRAWGVSSKAARFREQYERFCEILALNDATLELIADIEDVRSGRARIDLDTLARRLRRSCLDVSAMVQNLDLMAGGRWSTLNAALHAIRSALEEELPPDLEALALPLAVNLERVRASAARLVGGKMASLGEVGWGLAGAEVPDGFVITTAAFAKFMTHNRLWDRLDRLGSLVRRRRLGELAAACTELRQAVQEGEVPPEVAKAIDDAYLSMAAGQNVTVAMRSSAVGEDGEASHAGQYHSELNVDRSRLLVAYRAVLASAYAPEAVSYRLEQGLAPGDVMMAVGCLRMLTPRCAGVLLSRDFTDRDADRMVISATPGIGAALVAGSEAGREMLTDGDGRVLAGDPELVGEQLVRLARTGRVLERYFGHPQDVEWAVEPDGTVFVLQARRMAFAGGEVASLLSVGEGLTPLLEGGLTACPGASRGTVVHWAPGEPMEDLAEGCVVVTSLAAAALSKVMPRCAAIITEVGSPTGHMSIIAREFDVPCIVGAAGARRVLQPGQVVTVDALRCRVFEGALPVPERPRRKPAAIPDVPAAEEVIERVARLVTPLHLTDPTAKEFAPERCTSLHDISRFVHEKVFTVMFQLGDLAASDPGPAVSLDARLPFKLLVVDVGGGIESSSPDSTIDPEHVRSVPMQAFLVGLLDPSIRWDQPRPLSARGFLSVVGEGLAGPPPQAQQIGRTSFAVVSDCYMNFSTKAGYHFSTVDTYCGEASLNKNYIHFRFAGGAASEERRQRRVRFLRSVLRELDFVSTERGDVLTARLEKCERELILSRLCALGRLTMVSRQLDMLMDNDDSPHLFARAFLQGRMDVF